MKKSGKRKQPSSNRASRKQAAASQAEAPVTRRGALARFGKWGALGVVLEAGGVWYAVDTSDSVAYSDLSEIGKGVPAIVQIHDPGCPTCRALQKETRAALEGFGPSELKYVVANIKSTEGARFAALQGVPHVTLLVFDGQGRRQMVLTGPNNRDRLKLIFSRYAAKPPKKVEPEMRETGEGAPTS